jgi:hypothetical protein
MKLSGWIALYQNLITELQKEVGMPIPALEEFRVRIAEAAPIAERRKAFEDEFDALVDSQSFLREATTRWQRKKAADAIESATALHRRAEQFLPKDEERGNEIVEKGIENEIEETAQLRVIDVWDAIKSAEEILPGQAVPKGKSDPRWQAIMEIEDFVDEEPDALWEFTARWGVSEDEDLRTAIGVCLLEHLLACHFERIFPRVEEAVRGNALFADTFLKCWEVGQAGEEGNSERFRELQAMCQKGRSES